MYDREIHDFFIEMMKKRKGALNGHKKKYKRCPKCGTMGKIPCGLCQTRNFIETSKTDKKQMVFEFFEFEGEYHVDEVKIELQLFGKDLERYKQVKQWREFIKLMKK